MSGVHHEDPVAAYEASLRLHERVLESQRLANLTIAVLFIFTACALFGIGYGAVHPFAEARTASQTAAAGSAAR